MSFILTLFKENKIKIFIFLFFSIITSLIGVLTLVFINEFLLKSNLENPNIIVYFAFLLILFFLSSSFVEISLSSFGQKFIFKMQRRVIKQILDTSILNILNTTKARILASLNNDVRSISFGLLRFPEFIQSSVLIFCTSAYIAYLSFEIFLLCFVWIVFVFVINHFLMSKVYFYFKRARENDDALQKNYQNILQGHNELTLNPLRAKQYYESEFEFNALKKKKNSTIGNVLHILSNNWSNSAMLALVGVEFYIVLTYKLTGIENATTIALSILFLRTPLVSMIGSFPTILMAKIALDKIAKLNLQEYRQDFKIINKKIQWKKIVFKDVCFAYGEKFSLKPINFELQKGDTVFLIGKNGSGKSTFSMILAGLFTNFNGKLYLDNEEINLKNIYKYRALISAIFSDFHLFTKILRDENFLEEDLKYWLEILELDEKIELIEDNFSTIKLSAGQKKRLAMLVALLEKKDILILDEWAADQDPMFRKFFYQKLLPLLKQKGITIFAITHDDTYFDIADRILLAQDGYIQELQGDIKNIAKNVVEKF
ncbi:multidrug ABC transporter permease/ATP-binding protein [Campylobacter insulaenigrae]|uniref:Multidrug ABC transporter permease/ATP-binding protein n=1 Tax=Campylobacter insulaenigrae TaxID=260714 RepID=A0ABY3G4U1_9BACT|nr:multidrug ABC transporter permease/ATP-binding protein [Campylobacter insulaenigrae]MCR6571131.1 multidrug ABC transporter permease/ATP-binding protein [Campylobacter insulaenigrae]MCR6583338.1 multidrug ABC transporter permease/ATP-binding protein [Campylobacter insulaenigrae]MCR6587931.1 multidrug ABC transporter permease/ATP-binding protein [Campylobacter insulaenigrae]MCR6591479.1 multidrug ABC transporter permease/ATP-binding protein [Campylobacter insulaenigrae]MCR6593014.1 multidrug 